MLDSLRLTLKVRKERKAIDRAMRIIEEQRKQRHIFMMELSAAGYDIVRKPSL
jgi:hypothetical protein